MKALRSARLGRPWFFTPHRHRFRILSLSGEGAGCNKMEMRASEWASELLCSFLCCNDEPALGTDLIVARAISVQAISILPPDALGHNAVLLVHPAE